MKTDDPINNIEDALQMALSLLGEHAHCVVIGVSVDGDDIDYHVFSGPRMSALTIAASLVERMDYDEEIEVEFEEDPDDGDDWNKQKVT